jgi:LysR family hydrogen peroxide-inducible transcriptional activator
MTLTELRYIVTLAQERHFGRAAEKCFVSQPTLSVAVKKLESELNTVLFERSKNAIRPTPLGEQIIQQADKILAETRILKELADMGKGQLENPLKVGAIFTIGPYLFPYLVPKIYQQAPNMALFIEESYTAVLRRELREGELDAIIIALPFNEPDVITRSLYDEPFVVVMPKDHPLTKLSHIPPDILPDQNLLLLGEGHCFRDQVLEICPSLIHQKNNQVGSVTQGSSLETLKYMVATGLGITVLPQSAVGNLDSNLITTRPFTQPVPSRTVALAWRASFPRGKAIDLLLDSASLCLPRP